jgi:hypothetical protein
MVPSDSWVMKAFGQGLKKRCFPKISLFWQKSSLQNPKYPVMKW